MSNEDDGQLLRGDAAGVGELYDRHSRAVFRLAYALLQDVNDANDVVQDTFVLLWRKRRQLTLVEGSSLPWLLVTARLTALAVRRRRATRRARSVGLERADMVPAASFNDADAVRVALAELPEQDRNVLTLVLVEHRSYAEAAAQLGISTTAVGKRLQRARGRFRASYSDPATTSQGADV
jgi:RNA polymerase sigma-70 factor (ECF subfamily)